MHLTSPSSSPDSFRRKPQILVIRHGVSAIIPEIQARVSSLFDIIDYDCLSVTECIERMAPGGSYSQIDAILRTGWLKSEPFMGQVLFRGPIVQSYPKSLKAIFCTGHGYDVADIPALTARGVIYCNTRDACTIPVANTALSLIINTYRYFSFAEHCTRNDMWAESRLVGSIGLDPSDQVLGIVGLGDIGLSIAKKAAAALDMRVHYWGPRRKSAAVEASVPGGASFHTTFESLLKVTDCLVFACPLTNDTYHLLSRHQFEIAKPGLRVVNIARGKIIDEEALVEALEAKKVLGVGLDVMENEPYVNKSLKDNYLVTLLPHVGVCSRTSWIEFEKKNWENAEDFFFGSGFGKTPVNKVDSR